MRVQCRFQHSLPRVQGGSGARRRVSVDVTNDRIELAFETCNRRLLGRYTKGVIVFGLVVHIRRKRRCNRVCKRYRSGGGRLNSRDSKTSDNEPSSRLLRETEGRSCVTDTDLPGNFAFRFVHRSGRAGKNRLTPEIEIQFGDRELVPAGCGPDDSRG